MKNYFKKYLLSFIFVGIHSLIVLAFSIYIGINLSSSPEYGMYWLWFKFIDFPISLLLKVLLSVIGDSFDKVENYYTLLNVFYTLYFLIMGGIQYFCIGLILKWVGKSKRKNVKGGP